MLIIRILHKQNYGESTIFLWSCSIAMLVYQRVTIEHHRASSNMRISALENRDLPAKMMIQTVNRGDLTLHHQKCGLNYQQWGLN